MTYAKSIGCNELRAGAEARVTGLVDERVVSNELVGDDLDSNELCDFEQLVARHTQEEGNGVHDVTEQELQSQVGLAVLGDVEIAAPPAEHAVDQTNESNNAEQS